MSADIVNSGCPLNTCQGQPVIDTRAVTGQAERQARHAVARAHREAPGRAIVVTGCAARITGAAPGSLLAKAA